MHLNKILQILVGTALFSFALQYLVIPYQLFEGGATGITLIVYYLLKIPVWLTNILINAPLLYLGRKAFGNSFLIYSIIGSLSVSGWLLLFEKIPLSIQVSNDLLIVSVLTGILFGLGLGLVFRAGGTTGGSDIVARLLENRTPLSLGQLMFALDFSVLALELIVFQNLRLITYTLLFVFITSRVIDLITEGGYAGRGFIIVSKHNQQIAQAISSELNRGVTVLQGQGYYSQEPIDVLYCVVSRSEIQEMKALIHRLDPRAFTTITEAHEIIGEGFLETFQPEAKHETAR